MKLKISDTLSLPLDWMTLATVVYGARGAGKTSFGRVVAEELTAAKQRFCAIDLKGDWFGLKSTAAGDGPGIPVVVFGGDHADLPLEQGAGKFIAETVAGLEQSTIIDVEYLSKGKQVEFLTDFFERLYHANREPLLVLADEAQRYAPQKPMNPQQTQCLGAVEDLVKLGRKHGIGVVMFTQRGSSLNKECSELCDAMVAYRSPGVLDQSRIKDWLEANATREQRDEVMSQLSGLPTGTAAFASNHPDLKLFQVAAVRRPWTFDSSATPKPGQRKVEPKVLAESDIEELKQRMADAIERAKADDPKELRAKIVRLERELAAAVRAVDDAASRVEVETVVETVVDEVPVPVLADDVQAEIRGHLQAVVTAFDAVIERLTGWEVVHAPVPRAPTPEPLSRRRVQEQKAAPQNNPRSRSLPAAEPPSDIKLGKGERNVLAVLAQHTDGLTNSQLSFLCGYSNKASTLSVILGKLRRLELVEPGQPVRATAAGLATAGGPQGLPTGPALLDYWMHHKRFGEGERRVLRVLVDQYPRALSHEELCDLTGYSPDASTTSVILGKLRKFGLVQKTARLLSDDFAEAIR